MDLTIIIVNHNSYNFLISCIRSIRESLEATKLKYGILVIDNASGSQEQKRIEKIVGITRIFNNKNVGFGKACNQGILKAQGEFILLLNPDILVLNKAIDKLFNFIKEKNNCFVGAKLLNKDNSVQSSCGLFFTLPVVFTMLFLKGEQLGLTKFSPRKTEKVDWVSGACLLGRKKDFLKVALFDNKIFLYTEEVDFLLRAKLCGYSCYF
ncbi:MAG: glycosyltransferase family 2 protein [Actinobacteria bacterium]|nr:glycosyltransferase family 2 protein [Actinomycetota bacterium]